MDLRAIPRERIPIAIGMVLLLAFLVTQLQGRFDSTDVKKGIALALAHHPAPGSPTIFELLAARQEGDPRCDGHVVSMLLGDVAVTCATPGQASVEYEFRVLLDGKRPPRPANVAAEGLVAGLGRK